jgi:hypothetical protein
LLHVHDLCSILNEYDVLKINKSASGEKYFSNWKVDKINPRNTFFNEICSDPAALHFLKENGYFEKRDICWSCGDQEHKEHLDISILGLYNVEIPVCNKCSQQLSKKSINTNSVVNKDAEKDTYWYTLSFFCTLVFIYAMHIFTKGTDVEDHFTMSIAALIGIYSYYMGNKNRESKTIYRLVYTRKGNKILVSSYILWAFIQITFFIISEKSEYNSQIFWPFSNNNINDSYNTVYGAYDISELFVYTGFPLVISFIFRIFKRDL